MRCISEMILPRCLQSYPEWSSTWRRCMWRVCSVALAQCHRELLSHCWLSQRSSWCCRPVSWARSWGWLWTGGPSRLGDILCSSRVETLTRKGTQYRAELLCRYAISGGENFKRKYKIKLGFTLYFDGFWFKFFFDFVLKINHQKILRKSCSSLQTNSKTQFQFKFELSQPTPPDISLQLGNWGVIWLTCLGVSVIDSVLGTALWEGRPRPGPGQLLGHQSDFW